MVVSLLMAAIGCIHFLIRPHLFTLAFVYLTLRVCQKQHERGGWVVAWVPVFTVILANLHGGFLACPSIVRRRASGSRSRAVGRGAAAKLASGSPLAFVASCLAALVNPYGFGLYRHVGHLLVSSGVTELIDEYQPAPFGKPEARVLEMGRAGPGRPAGVSRGGSTATTWPMSWSGCTWP